MYYKIAQNFNIIQLEIVSQFLLNKYNRPQISQTSWNLICFVFPKNFILNSQSSLIYEHFKILYVNHTIVQNLTLFIYLLISPQHSWFISENTILKTTVLLLFWAPKGGLDPWKRWSYSICFENHLFRIKEIIYLNRYLAMVKLKIQILNYLLNDCWN